MMCIGTTVGRMWQLMCSHSTNGIRLGITASFASIPASFSACLIRQGYLVHHCDNVMTNRDLPPVLSLPPTIR
jgi:hypothetical protein